MVEQSGRTNTPTQPDKLCPDFPLDDRAAGRWAEKIRRHFHYFGTWDDPQAALTE
jgi:hypothetical protein